MLLHDTYAKHSSYKEFAGKFRRNVPYVTVPSRNWQIYLKVSSNRFHCTLDENMQKTCAEVN